MYFGPLQKKFAITAINTPSTTITTTTATKQQKLKLINQQRR